MKRQDRFDKTLKLLRALATPLRLQVMAILSRHDFIGIPLIMAKLGPRKTSLSNLVEQLQSLVKAGLVETRRSGNRTFYGLSRRRSREAAGILEALARQVGVGGNSGRRRAQNDGGGGS